MALNLRKQIDWTLHLFKSNLKYQNQHFLSLPYNNISLQTTSPFQKTGSRPLSMTYNMLDNLPLIAFNFQYASLLRLFIRSAYQNPYLILIKPLYIIITIIKLSHGEGRKRERERDAATRCHATP